MITYDQFKQVELRAGLILSAEHVPETDKLLKLSVDLGEAEPRPIVSGIAGHYPEPSALVGRTVLFVANLEPRVIRGCESRGMILAIADPEGAFSLLEPGPGIKPGTLAG